ncbi:unnamed protein product [Mycena citricolor]|uniref:Domain of unknown function at the cortex 1 domain-containing protein n=1 Tax=Mycena citricolor TaxID=2018698 RepID=A0AAD2HWI3_9AGAR|nr:unnamed protein product [Mycena citricolor]
MPKLQVLAGPSLQSLTPISTLVNKNVPFRISTAEWEGEITVFIKGFNDGDPSSGADDEYFSRPDRQGITWSIQVQGNASVVPTFLASSRNAKAVSCLPALQMISSLATCSSGLCSCHGVRECSSIHEIHRPHFVARLDLHCYTQTMGTLPACRNHASFRARSIAPWRNAAAALPPGHSIADETSSLHLCSHARRSSTPSSINSSSSKSSSSSRGSIFSKRIRSKSRGSKSPVEVVPQGMTAQQRRSFFSDEGHRKSVTFGPQDVITTDFCYGFLEFSPSLRLRLPGGLGFDLARYWDGQGVRFVCCERRHDTVADDADVHHDTDFSSKPDDSRPADDQSDPWGPVFWCVSIEMADE